jgi:hypothetical protein
MHPTTRSAFPRFAFFGLTLGERYHGIPLNSRKVAISETGNRLPRLLTTGSIKNECEADGKKEDRDDYEQLVPAVGRNEGTSIKRQQHFENTRKSQHKAESKADQQKPNLSLGHRLTAVQFDTEQTKRCQVPKSRVFGKWLLARFPVGENPVSQDLRRRNVSG